MLHARFLAPIFAAVALALAFLPGLARADVPSQQIPESLRAAIQQHVESKGKEYAGLCVDVNANPPLPFGKYCAFVLSIEHDIAEVSYGPVASNDITRASFKNQGGAWKLMNGNDVPTPMPPTKVPQSAQLPAGLGNAIKQYIESKGHQYAGLCLDVNDNPPLPFGKYCAFVLSIEHDIAEVSFGPVASNDISLVSFKLEGGAWKVMGAQTPAPSPTSVPPTATPSATPTTPANPTTPSVVVPPALLQAIKQHIEASGKQYAGLCVDVNANPPLPFGKYCAFVNSIAGGIADVSYGPVASNDITRVTFRLENGQWTTSTASPVTVTPTHQAPQPPNTGSGNEDSGPDIVVILMVAAALFGAAGLGSLALQRR